MPSSRSPQKRSNFSLPGQSASLLDSYDPLRDPNLQHYFQNPTVRHHLAHSLIIDKRGTILTQSQTAERIIEQEFHKLEKQREFLDNERQWKLKKQKRDLELQKEYEQKRERVRKMRGERQSLHNSRSLRSQDLANSPPKILDNGLYNSYDLVEHFMSDEMVKMRAGAQSRPVSRQKRKLTSSGAPRLKKSSDTSANSTPQRKALSASYNHRSMPPSHTSLIASNQPRVSVDDIHEWNHVIGQTDSMESLLSQRFGNAEDSPVINSKSSRLQRLSIDLNGSRRTSLPSLHKTDEHGSAEKKRTPTERKQSVTKNRNPRQRIQSSKLRTKLYNHISHQQSPVEEKAQVTRASTSPHLQSQMSKVTVTKKPKVVRKKSSPPKRSTQNELIVQPSNTVHEAPSKQLVEEDTLQAHDASVHDQQHALSSPEAPMTLPNPEEISSEQDSEQAAVTIQKYFRSYEARKTFSRKKKEHNAAVKIQAQARGYLSRKDVEKRRQERLSQQAASSPEHNEVDLDVFDNDFENLDDLNDIPADAHTKPANLATQNLKFTSSTVQAPSEDEMHQAASVIQRNIRVKLAKKELEKKLQQEKNRQQNDAAVLIQRNIRGKLARTKVVRRKKQRAVENSAAITIQRNIRGTLARHRVDNLRKNAPLTAKATAANMASEPEEEISAEANQFEVDFEHEVKQQLDDFADDFDDANFEAEDLDLGDDFDDAPGPGQEDDDSKSKSAIENDQDVQETNMSPEAPKPLNNLSSQEDEAAIVIQRNIRKTLAKKEVETRKSQQQEHQQREQSAVVIQRNVRKRIAQKRVQSRREQFAAVTKIQSNVRRRIAQKELQLRKEEYKAIVEQEQHEAAILIQRIVRQKLAEKELKEMREQNDAAVVIQRNIRGRLARKDIAPRREANVTEPVVTEQPTGVSEDHAAATIQRNVRRHLAQKEMQSRKTRRDAALTIQRSIRVKLARHTAEERRQELASEQERIEKEEKMAQKMEPEELSVDAELGTTIGAADKPISDSTNGVVPSNDKPPEKMIDDQFSEGTAPKVQPPTIEAEDTETSRHEQAVTENTPLSQNDEEIPARLTDTTSKDHVAKENAPSADVASDTPLSIITALNSAPVKESAQQITKQDPPASPLQNSSLTIVDSHRKDSAQTLPSSASSFIGALQDLHFPDLDEMEKEDQAKTAMALVESDEFIDEDFAEEAFEEDSGIPGKKLDEKQLVENFDYEDDEFAEELDELEDDMEFDVDHLKPDFGEDEFMDEDGVFG